MSGRYRAFGLEIESERPLPELAPAVAGGPPDLRIRWGEVPKPPDGETGALRRCGSDVWLTVRGVARFWIPGGREIVVDALPGVSDREVRVFLLGSAIGAFCLQQGLLPLHASAVVAHGGAVAFAGRSGVGKSTLVAQLQSRGHPVLCDDVCVVGVSPVGGWVAQPGLPRIKLWRDALDRLGRDAGGLERVLDKREKYHLPLPADARGPCELRRLYVLSDAETDAPEILRLGGPAAVEALLGNVYRKEYLRGLGRLREAFEQAVALVGQVAVFSAPRLRGFEFMNAETDRLERHFLERELV